MFLLSLVFLAVHYLRLLSRVVKLMSTVFWDQRRVVMMDFLAKGTKIIGTY